MNYKDAVCCGCQRLIVDGAYYRKAARDHVMVQHPAAGVNIDVSKKEWPLDFNPRVHFVCSGSGQTPQWVQA